MFSPNKWVRTVSFFPGFLIIGILILEGCVIPNHYIPAIKLSSSSNFLLHILHFLFFLWCYIACWWSFFACIFTHPGPVTSDYLHDYEEQFGPSQLRYCTICQSVKPPRCHHCSICQMCVVNMDHHCPWFCNCIGYQNKKFFFLCLFYAWVGSIDIVLSLLSKIFSSGLTLYSIKHYSPLNFLCGVLAFALALTLIFFGGFHLYLILTDQTTIEANAIFRNFFSHIGRKSHQKIPFRENWCIVMDRKWYLWFLPVHSNDFKFEWNFLYESDGEESDEDGWQTESSDRAEMRRLIQRAPVPKV